jgi:very-short-patch-repair endonuclease
MTHTHLERRFLPIIRRAGLPKPQSQRYLGTNRVDFVWPELELVVETDGLTYHRTAAQQAEGLRRDHAHAGAGLLPLHFSHAQIRYEPAEVEQTLLAVARRRPGPAPR